MSDPSKVDLNSLIESFLSDTELDKLQVPSPDPVKNYGESDVQQLKELHQILIQSYSFTEGQVVKWKKGLKNKRLPEETQPAIVIKVLTSPVLKGEENSGSSYFREPLDLILGMVDRKGKFVTFHYDKRRFEPWLS